MSSQLATAPSPPLLVASIMVEERRLEMEYQIIDHGSAGPTLVFLHEGLGSLLMWRDFPSRLCGALHCRGIVYSRPGYGRSTPLWPAGKWPLNFMHIEATEVLPRFLTAIGLKQPAVILGHSDGGSIALLFARASPDRCAGIITAAAHAFVEPITIDNISKAKDRFANPIVFERLSKYHLNPRYVLDGWSGAWLDPAFRHWNIEAELRGLTVPTLLIQGEDDEYGTLEQVRRIAAGANTVSTCVLPDCGHSPHVDHPLAMIDAIERFLRRTVRWP
jgi:pimeloyl-ACP methyl ester carboxylesterase